MATATIRDIMTTDLVACDPSTSITDAARLMRDCDVGNVLVGNDGRLMGIVTDRDLVVRCLADGADPNRRTLADVCSGQLTTVDAGDDIDGAAQLMRDHAVRRLPVVDHGRPVGIVSLGDLARERDPYSALGGISAAPPNA